MGDQVSMKVWGVWKEAGKLSFRFSTVGVYAGSLRVGNPLHDTQRILLSG